ncbi:MAG: glycosyl transferase family 2 [Planctomycetaceae bacterium]|nr:glycosyl transferase family 2 [Planctomycetaceae bacterium]
MISVVLPFYNEEETIPSLYQRLTAAADGWNEDYEVIAIDDGSKDATAGMLNAICRDDPRWKLLRFSRNFGHQAAVSAGIHYSHGDAVVVMDSDLQDPPEQLHRFLDKWREGFQVVYAIRTKRKENVFKRTGYFLFYRILQRLSTIDIPLDSGDFSLMDRSVVEVLKKLPERTRFVRGLRSWAGFRQIGVAYERDARFAGEAKYTFTKLVQLAVNGLLSFSSAPLRLASYLGFVLCGLSICLIGFLVLWKMTGVILLGMKPGTQIGWTSLISLILFLSGIQMLVIGAIGEYLARVFDEVQGRPPWIIGYAQGFETRPIGTPIGWCVSDIFRPSPAAWSPGQANPALVGGPRAPHFSIGSEATTETLPGLASDHASIL